MCRRWDGDGCKLVCARGGVMLMTVILLLRVRKLRLRCQRLRGESLQRQAH